MRKMTVVLLTAAFVSIAAGAWAQAPSFAGKWTLVPDPSAPAPAGPGGGGRGGGRGGGFGQFCGMECTVTQDATSLVVTRTTQAGEVKATYKLDGTESKNTMTMGGGGMTMESVSKAMRDGGKIVITTVTDMSAMGGAKQEAKVTLSLDASGSMVVERTAPGFQDPTPVTTKQTYKKG